MAIMIYIMETKYMFKWTDFSIEWFVLMLILLLLLLITIISLLVRCLHYIEAISTNILCVFFTIAVPTLSVSKSEISACPNSVTISLVSGISPMAAGHPHPWLLTTGIQGKWCQVLFWKNWQDYLHAFINGDTAILLIFWDGCEGAI